MARNEPSGPGGPGSEPTSAGGSSGADRTPDTTPPGGPSGTRRDFLTRTGNLLVGACALGAAAGAVRLTLPEVQQIEATRFPLGAASDFRIGTLTWLRAHELFVVHDEDGFGVFSSRCTHLGCTVRRTAEGFFCPCHGARYGHQGQVLQGPAREPLPWYHVWVETDGRIWVDTEREIEAGTHVLQPASPGS